MKDQTPDSQARFNETQRFVDSRLGMLLVVLAAIATGFAAVSTPAGGAPALAGTVASLLALVLLVGWRQDVQVWSDRVDVRIRPFVHKSVPLQDIRAAEARTYRPIVEYGGWGVRRGRDGWAYNVHGNRGVSLRLEDGSSLLIGSQRGDELAAAIHSAGHSKSASR